jgi:hypothetical protein
MTSNTNSMDFSYFHFANLFSSTNGVGTKRNVLDTAQDFIFYKKIDIKFFQNEL